MSSYKAAEKRTVIKKFSSRDALNDPEITPGVSPKGPIDEVPPAVAGGCITLLACCQADVPSRGVHCRGVTAPGESAVRVSSVQPSRKRLSSLRVRVRAGVAWPSGPTAPQTAPGRAACGRRRARSHPKAGPSLGSAADSQPESSRPRADPGGAASPVRRGRRTPSAGRSARGTPRHGGSACSRSSERVQQRARGREIEALDAVTARRDHHERRRRQRCRGHLHGDERRSGSRSSRPILQGARRQPHGAGDRRPAVARCSTPTGIGEDPRPHCVGNARRPSPLSQCRYSGPRTTPVVAGLITSSHAFDVARGQRQAPDGLRRGCTEQHGTGEPTSSLTVRSGSRSLQAGEQGARRLRRLTRLRAPGGRSSQPPWTKTRASG